MIRPINIATGGYFCSTLSISVDGYLCPEKDIDLGGGGGGFYKEVKENSRDLLQEIREDDKEVLLFIKIFTRWL